MVYCRGPCGMRESEPSQDRKVAAIRMPSYASRHSPAFIFLFLWVHLVWNPFPSYNANFNIKLHSLTLFERASN